MVGISYYYQLIMANPEARCGNCRYFDTNDVNGNRIKPIGTQKERSGIVGFCRAQFGLALGDREPEWKCLMPEGTFEPAQPSFTQNPVSPQKSPAL